MLGGNVWFSEHSDKLGYWVLIPMIRVKDMTTATLTSKGKITIPAVVRKNLHVGPGDRIEFVRLSDGRYEIFAAVRDVVEIKGMIKTNKVISLEQMEKAIKPKLR